MKRSPNQTISTRPSQASHIVQSAQQYNKDYIAPEKQAAFTRAVTTKNPLALSSFEERGASIAAKLDRIRENPQYQKLSPKQQEGVRAKMYDEYIVPSYKGFNLPVPPKDTWVALTAKDQSRINGSGTNKANHSDASAFFDSKGMQAGVSGLAGIDRVASGISLFGTKVANKIFQQLHGIDSAFSAHLPESFTGHRLENENDAIKSLTRSVNTQKQRMDGVNVWLNTHYGDKSTLNSLSGMAGELVAGLPLYEAVGTGLSAAGVKAGLEAGPGVIGKASKISAKLTSTKLGQWVYGTLKSATDGYISGLATTGDKSSANMGAALGGVMGGASHALPSFASIKKWSASILAMGGIPFGEDLAASAMHETTFPMEHFNAIDKYKPYKPEVSSADTRATGTYHEMPVGNGIVIKSATEGKGYIHFAGVDHPYRNVEERQAVYSKVEKLAEQTRMLEDPLMGQLHLAEKVTQDSISQQMYGKGVRNLSEQQRQRVMSQRLKLNAQAAEEAPVHLPELQKAEVQHNVEQELAQNPARAARHKQWEQQFGTKLADVVTANTVSDVATTSGIKDSSAVLNKITKGMKKKAASEAARGIGPTVGEYEPAEGATAFHNLKRDSVAYLKNPSGGRRAEDGTLVGARDKRSWNEVLKSDNREKFVGILKEADGNMRFENDLHRMLYHYSNRASLEPALKNKLVREMAKLKPKGVTEWGAKEMAVAADNTALHLYELAKSGRLSDGETMFHSTNINPNWSPTQWQMQLHNENDQEQLDAITNALKRHPKQLRAVTGAVKTMMSMKYTSTTIDEYLKLDEQIRQTALQARVGVIVKGSN